MSEMTSIPPPVGLQDIDTNQLKKLLRPIRSTSENSRAHFQNWSGEFKANPLAIFKPVDEHQIKLILELCRRESRTIRCFGSGHSPSDLACSDDYMMNLDWMSGLIEVDQSTKTIEAWAGTRLKDFIRLSHQHNLSLSVLGSISEQSIGGAISTAIHGCGYDYGCFSTYVESLTLILADSSQVTVNESEGKELFQATLCGLGLTGVITRVKLRCEDSFNLEETTYAIPFDVFVNNYDRIARSAEHVRMYWYPQVDQVKVEKLNRTTKPRDRDTWRTLLRDKLMGCFQWYIQPAILLLTRYLPDITDSYMTACYHLLNQPTVSIEETEAGAIDMDTLDELIKLETLKRSPKPRINTSASVFNFDCGPPHHTYEGAIPYELTAEALREFRSFLLAESRKVGGGLKMHFPMEIRPVAADGIWLSPSCGQRVTYLGIVQFKAFGMEINGQYKNLFKAFEKILQTNYYLRPHWAKKHSQTFKSLEKLYGSSNNNFQRFLDVRNQVDPHFRFLNHYVFRHFVKNNHQIGDAECDEDQAE
ncbi:D-arabinono-1,4-lactone oxidase [Puccinia graminis f. sp. tritici]|uniref:D-arabinono-1,4-lactone oxidase n=1 Tax=Puccinia graminis f. sp. tritici TaxID=56615 RepID=A0A5B0MX38_PUCGR|nr:D-arabinono-1,4-lactone oxidase [Puccinia graminis f. sp. tritici]